MEADKYRFAAILIVILILILKFLNGEHEDDDEHENDFVTLTLRAAAGNMMQVKNNDCQYRQQTDRNADLSHR